MSAVPPFQEIHSLKVKTLGGADVSIAWLVRHPPDFRAHAVVVGPKGRFEGEFGSVQKANGAKMFDKVRQAGATHVGVLGDAISSTPPVLLAFDTATAAQIEAAAQEAGRIAAQMKADEDAEQRARLRATETVHRVLRHSPNWGGYFLDEGYDAPPGAFRGRVFHALPGAEERIHQACPSIRTISHGRPCDAAFYGHDNALWVLSDLEVDALRRETADLDARDDLARKDADAAEAERIGRLKTTKVPDDAVEAFRQHRGDDERAWEQGDERGAMLIRHYGEAIEAQGIAFADPAQAEFEIHPPGA